MYEEIVEKFGFSEFFSKLVSQRIDNYEDLRFYADKCLVNLLSPFYFPFINDCILRIRQAIENKEKVLLFSDRDADGLTSLALMQSFLKSKGVNPLCKSVDDFDEYGVKKDDIDFAKNKNISLIIFLDLGCSEKEVIKYSKSIGIDVIVIDHHLMISENVPDCIIINPKADYPFSHLSACATCSKVIWAYEFSYLKDWNKDLNFLVVENTDIGVNISICTMNNFISQKPINYYLNVIDEFPEIVTSENFSDKVFFVLDDDEIYSSLSKHVKILSLRQIFSKYLKFSVGKSLVQIKQELEKKIIPTNGLIDVLVYLYKSYYLASHSNISFDFVRYLDLVAISTIGDLMPIKNENLILVKLGLEQLNKRERKNLLGLLSEKAIADRQIDEVDVSFYIVPLINAPWRMGRSEISRKLLLESDINMIDIYSREVKLINNERRNACQKIVESVDLTQILQINRNSLAYMVSEHILPGLTGLIANDLKKRYDCFASLVITKKDSRLTGSIRVPDIAVEILDECKDLLKTYGGHFSAAGFSFYSEDKIPEFISKVEKIIQNKKTEEIKKTDEYDISLNVSKYSQDMINQVECLSPFGMENPMPIIQFKGLDRSSFSIFKGKKTPHLQCNIIGENSSALQGIYWNEGNKLDELDNKNNNIVGSFAKSYYNGKKKYYFNIKSIS